MNPVLFQIGDFSIRWYAILILVGVIIGYILVKYEANKHGAPKDFVFNLAFYTVIFGLIGARIYYVIFNWNLYSHDVLSIFKFWEGGLAIHGGIIFGLIAMSLYCKKYNVRLFKITDMVVPALLIAQAIGRWGNFFNSEAYGPATTLAALKGHVIIPDFVINGMNIGGTYYEPCFYYESLFCLIGFIIVLIIRSRKTLHIGTITSFYFIWYGIGRFIIEGLRTDSLMLGGFKMAQIVSVIMVVVGLIIAMINSRRTPFENQYHEKDLSSIIF